MELPLTLADFDRLARGVPLLVDLAPSGRFLMEEFFYAGGMPALLRRLGDVLDGGVQTVSGRSLAEQVAGAPCWDDQVIRPLEAPVQPDGGIAVLRGNLAPDGAIIKPAAATPALLRHRGPAIVFENWEDLVARLDSPELPFDAGTVMVLKNAGPKGYPGMPEVGNLPLPRRLLEQGVRDLVRISDARMSGTAYGTVILHVAPEAAAGGMLALVRDADMIELDVAARRLTLDVPEDELARRRAAWSPLASPARGGYERLYVEHVLQADCGADFDFLVGRRGAAVPKDNH
jgi:dihydroxyacid dehydratase/phosphogluconate dehydratase